MKLTKSLLLGATILTTALCSCGSSSESDHDRSDGPKDEGRKLAKLQYDLEIAYEKYGYDSDEVKEITEKYQEFVKRLQIKFDRDTTGMGEFTAAFTKKYEELRKEGYSSRAFGCSYERAEAVECIEAVAEEAPIEYEEYYDKAVDTVTLAY